MPIILAANMNNPLLWAVLIGWIISVVLHEFAHGVVAFWGGDYTIRDRGGLTLNPLQYVDPMFSIVVPAIILAIGGIPLPGGVTYVRTDLLRSRFWDTAVSLSGPAMNFLLFLACAIPLHPKLGWVDPNLGIDSWTTAQIFVAAMAVLQLMAAVLNLFPIPPLDGYRAISPYLPHDVREWLARPAISMFAFIAFFLILARGGLFVWILYLFMHLLTMLGFDAEETRRVMQAYFEALHGK